jgi:hypothetical protein
MLILWIRKNRLFKQSGDDKKESQLLQERADILKRFRLEHPDIAINNAKDILTEDGNLLASIQGVKLWPNIQN